MEVRKNIKIKVSDWRKLRQLAANQDMTLQAEVDAILESFLECTEETKKDREK
jgi:predicted DNA-binding ribbon-helix-helix protein